MAPNPFTSSQDIHQDLETALRRLRPTIGRVLAETAGAFLASDAVPASDWTAMARLPDLGVLQCSQRNVGEKQEMICNLTVEKSEWLRLLGASGCEDYCQDAFCEMVNCLCGSLLADAVFQDEFGYLIPCVPYAGHFRVGAGTRGLRGAFRIGGVTVHYAIAILHTAVTRPRQAILAA